MIARARAFGSSGNRPAWCLRDVQYDRAGFEQGETVFFVSRDLSERVTREMRGLFHLFERHEPNVVNLSDFFERPADRHVARQPPAAIG